MDAHMIGMMIWLGVAFAWGVGVGYVWGTWESDP
jgi:hypothetical protein